jgi:hypothetical protein
MKIVQTPPLGIYERAKALWGVDFDKGVIFTYGDTIHAKHDLTPDLIEHESTHIQQQLLYPGGPEAWWDKYFTDGEFRLSQELEAYRRQYSFLVNQFKLTDPNQKFNIARMLGEHLSGQMYGRIVNIYQAINLIKNG